jgi:hypothetical protein
MQKNFREHFSKFTDMIRNDVHFAFARYSDGELYILQNKELVLDKGLIQIGEQKQGGFYQPADFKHYDPKEHGFYQQKLVEAYKHRQTNYYKGISCSCCVGKEAFDWQVDLHGGDDESLTWANLWVNGNYPAFIMATLPIFYSKDCVFVGHESADTSKLPFIKKDFRVGYNAMINDYGKIEEIKTWIKENNIQNHLFLFSASTFSNLAIYELFKEYPNNSYVDIGTCLTPMMNMPTERGYLKAFWNYTGGQDIQKICIWN